MVTRTLDRSADALAQELGLSDRAAQRPIVCVQGLGHVGSAMAAAVATAEDADGRPWYDVIGVDLDTPLSRAKIDAVNRGELPVACTDGKFAAALRTAHQRGNLVATSDATAYSLASVVVIDVPFDVEDIHGEPSLPWPMFTSAMRTVFEQVSPGTLVLVETTVPPGTCEKVVAPLAKQVLAERGMAEDAVLLAHSYERVMPGNEYFDSIVRFWRVFAGLTPEAGDACEQFLSRVIDVDNFPLRRLSSPTASETAKVLENSYRATNIAFIDEWGRFAEAVGVNMFEIIEAVRVRPTHNNIRQPGFGVGGYCLTKDPLMAKLASKELFEVDGLDFPFCTSAVATNNAMPLATLEMLDKALGGLSGKRVLLLGVSYRSDVGDTRYSPSQIFIEEARARGAEVAAHDPLLTRWHEMDMELPADIPAPDGFDAVVFAVGHGEYSELDLDTWLGANRPYLLDANRVLTDRQLAQAVRGGHAVGCIGRGDTH